ncbi:MAG TPA: hypothetical protein VIY98_04600 [Nitrososphaeraceae archaeon]
MSFYSKWRTFDIPNFTRKNTMVILYNRRYNATENKSKSVLVLDNKRYELEHTSPNINNQVVYTYIVIQDIHSSVGFTESY